MDEFPEYKPQPIDTSEVKLSEDILALTEKLAEHSHDIWARQRILEGWSHGAKQDDKAKTNPRLVSYEQLSDEDKDFDRRAAIEVLRAIVALGYRIEKDSTESPSA